MKMILTRKYLPSGQVSWVVSKRSGQTPAELKCFEPPVEKTLRRFPTKAELKYFPPRVEIRPRPYPTKALVETRPRPYPTKALVETRPRLYPTKAECKCFPPGVEEKPSDLATKAGVKVIVLLVRRRPAGFQEELKSEEAIVRKRTRGHRRAADRKDQKHVDLVEKRRGSRRPRAVHKRRNNKEEETPSWNSQVTWLCETRASC